MSRDSRRPFAIAALYGGCFVLGWLLHDLVYLAFTREPYHAAALLPGAAVALLLGVGVGAACGLGVRTYGPLVALVGAAVLGKPLLRDLVGVNVVATLTPLLAALLLGGVGFVIARRWRLDPVRVALGSGAALAAARALTKGDVNPAVEPRWGAAVVLVGATIVLGSTLMGRRWLSRAVAVVAIGMVAFVAVGRAGANLRLSRPDTLSPFPPTPDAGPSLLLVTLDTVRADHLGPYGYERVTTPHLDAWVRDRAVRFDQARSSSSWTLPSHASLFTGRYPGQHRATNQSPRADAERNPVGRFPARPLSEDIPTLAEHLVRAGYSTAAIAGNSAYLNHWFGLDRGFEHYDDRFPLHLPPRLLLPQLLGFRREIGRKYYRMAETITDLAFEWIDRDRGGRPFFLFLNYNDAHMPNVPPEPFAGAFEERRPADPLKYERSWLPLQYDRELLYLDSQLHRFLVGLEDRGLMDDTMVVITADHGEMLGDHGLWGHNKVLYEPVVRVPLYVKLPGPRQSPVVPRPVSGAEVHWMIRAALGLAEPGEGPTAPPGIALIGDWYHSDAIVEQARADYGPDVWIERDLLAWMEGGLKFIVASDGKVEVYDVARDPDESDNLATDDRVRHARAIAAAWWDDPDLAFRSAEP